MKVKVLADIRDVDPKNVQTICFKKGEIVELSAAGAAHYIEVGMAEAVAEPAADAPAEPAEAAPEGERKKGRF